MNATSHAYTASSTYTFLGRIQIDRSGYRGAWQTVHPDDLRSDVLEALASEDGTIEDGATATVGGQRYRAWSAE